MLGAGLVLIAAGIHSTGAATPLETERARLSERFRTLNVALFDSTLRTPISNDQGQLAWQVSFHLQALVEMLETTHDTLYASQFVRLADAVAAERDDQHQRVDEIRHHMLKGWGSRKYSMNHRTVWTVHTGLIVAPLAQFAALVRRNPAWAARYGAAAQRCLQIARESMASHDREFRPGPGPDEGRMLWFAESLPFNQQSVVGRAWLFIDAASESPPYQDRLARLARHLRQHMQRQPDSSLVWGYWVTLGELPTDREDISHGALGADFLVLCAEAGIGFTAADRRALERTFLQHVVKPDGRIAANVGGDGPLSAPTEAILLWGRLARHHSGVRDALLRLYHSDTFKSVSPQSELLGLAFLVASLPAATD
jgi:hypothetical protein